MYPKMWLDKETIMSAPISYKDLTTTTALGSIAALAANQLWLEDSNCIGINECVVALSGAILGSVVKMGVHTYFCDTEFDKHPSPVVRKMMSTEKSPIPLITATAACIIFALVRRD